MSELGDTFRAMKQGSQTKRRHNREKAVEALRMAGIEFESRNGGAHLIVFGEQGVVDFWPGTGLFIPHVGTRYKEVCPKGRGIRGLLMLLKEMDNGH